jgi:urease accessory protein
MTASAEIIAEPAPGGTTRLPVLQSQVPLVLRRTPEAVYLVSAAAGPLGGDRLSLRITVRAGATLRLRTVAACVALPGLDGGESLLAVTALVEPGGCLEYRPEPVVVADNARHATDIRVTLADGARLALRDELILGRHGELGGTYRGSLHVTYAGRPLLRQSLEVSGTSESSAISESSPASASSATAVARGPAILSGHRAVGNLLRVNAEAPAPPHDEWVAVMPLADAPATLVTALANDAVTLRRRLNGALDPQGTRNAP